jgi:hypothetical protein
LKDQNTIVHSQAGYNYWSIAIHPNVSTRGLLAELFQLSGVMSEDSNPVTKLHARQICIKLNTTVCLMHEGQELNIGSKVLKAVGEWDCHSLSFWFQRPDSCFPATSVADEDSRKSNNFSLLWPKVKKIMESKVIIRKSSG